LNSRRIPRDKSECTIMRIVKRVVGSAWRTPTCNMQLIKETNCSWFSLDGDILTIFNLFIFGTR
jgi:hypothetical protein